MEKYYTFTKESWISKGGTYLSRSLGTKIVQILEIIKKQGKKNCKYWYYFNIRYCLVQEYQNFHPHPEEE